MLALWLTTDDPERVREWASIPRLRGARVEVVDDVTKVPATALPGDGAAVAFVGAIAVDEATIARLLSDRKHVLLAGEPCLSSDALRRLAEAAHWNGVQLAVVNADRYLPSRRTIKQQIPTVIGNVGLVRVHRWQPREAKPIANSLGLPGTPGLPGALIRDLELVLWLTDKTPDMVFALERLAVPGKTTGQYLQVHLGFADGMDKIIPDLEKYLVRDSGHWTQQEKPDEVSNKLIEWRRRRFG